MGEINSTMPKKASRKKKTESADPYIQPIESEDKEGLSKEPPQDHPCSVPRASRVAICAPPGHGKSCLAKHIAVYSRPFATVYVIHGAGAATREWEKVKHTMTNFTQATAEYVEPPRLEESFEEPQPSDKVQTPQSACILGGSGVNRRWGRQAGTVPRRFDDYLG
jgi:hypothetical protein